MSPAERQTRDAEVFYVLGRTQAEYERLVRQSQVWEAATAQALDLVGLTKGQRALDVGCGTGDVMRLMADRVGPEGEIVGMDVDARIGRHGVEQLRRKHPGQYQFVEADVTQTQFLEQGPFDLVFARLLLFHLRDPANTLRRLWRWVRPGGALLIMDYDTTGARSVPWVPAIQAAARLINDAFAHSGRDIEIGTRIPTLMRTAGIGTCDGCVVSSVMLPARPSARMLRDVLVSLRPRIIETQLETADVMDCMLDELDRAAESDCFMRWPDLIATWKRKPE